MAKTQVVVFDIDGVLADFTAHFTKTAGIVLQYPIPVTTSAEHQSWSEFPGMKPEEVTKVWAHIANHPEFWEEIPSLLEPIDVDILKDLHSRHDVYFATSRRTHGALQATKNWLARHLHIVPSVVVTHRKGEFSKVVGANYTIDDKSENVDCVIWMTDGKTKSYVMDRPYNRDEKGPHSSKHRRVTKVSNFAQEVLSGK